jgi:ligand-binding sensor domain-containing protein
VHSQSLFYQKLNTANGIPTDRIYDLAKDNYEQIYIGTERGLYRFSGIKFQSLKLNKAVSNSVTDISFNKNNTLWCRNFSNQVFYSDGLELYPLENIDSSIEEEVIINLKLIDNYAYIATYEQVYILNAFDKKLIKKIESSQLYH